MPRRLNSDSGELTVAVDTNHRQSEGRIAALDGGGYVVALFDQTSNVYSFQRYSSAGTPVGAAIQGPAAASDFSSSAVVGLEGGGFAFAWIDGGAPATVKAKIQLYNPDGSAGALITDTTAWVQSVEKPPVIGALAGGGFVLVHEGNATGQIAMRIYGPDGVPIGPEIQLQSAPGARPQAPSVLGLPDGRFALVWEEDSFATGKSDIKLRLFQGDGTEISTTVVATGAQDQAAPRITQLPTGPLLVTWQEQGAAGWDIHAGIFDSGTGQLEGSSFLVNSQTAGDQTAPTVAALDNGEFAIAWVGADLGGRDLWESAIKIQVFAADGSRIGDERLLNTHLAGAQTAPQLAALEDGGLAAVWVTDDLPFPSPMVAVRTLAFDLANVTVTGGSDGDDLLDGTSGPDDISGLGGEDQINGGAGDDVLLGGGEDDVLAGGLGHDEMDGGDGADSLDGGEGNDIMLGGEGDDVLLRAGNLGFDRLDGGAGNDILDVSGGSTSTAAGAAVMIGGDGDDLLKINWGYNGVGYNETAIHLDAGAGNDRIEVGFLSGAARFTLGAGTDIVVFAQLRYGSIGSFGNGGGITITDFQAGAGGDRLEITGLIDRYIISGWDGVTNPITAGFVALEQSGANTLLRIRSIAGSDFSTYITFLNVSAAAFTNDNFDGLRVDGSAAVGVDREGTGDGEELIGTMGGEVINGNAGDDDIYLNAGNDTGSGGLGDDYIEGWSGNDSIDGGEGNDFLDGGEGDDIVSGGVDQDVVRGGNGDDVIDGGSGNDSLEGGPGSDTYIIDSNSGIDNIDELDSWLGSDRVRSSIAYTLGNGLEELELAGTGNIDGTGNAAANLLLGNSGANLLRGLGGADTLDGRGGEDTLEGGAGDDVYIVGDSAADVVEIANEGNDEVRTTLASYSLGANVEKLTGLAATGQLLTGNELANIIAGGSGADTLEGGLGNDRLDGGAGADQMTGGTGDDVFIVDNAGDQVTELADEGIDEVRTSLASYTLHAEVEKLTGLLTTGQSLTGNGGANIIAAGIGNDVIDGGLGADQMAGGGGNDIYVVDEAGDVVTEVAGAGTDEVRTALAVYALGANLENLTGLSSSGQQLTGNERSNTIAGGAGADVMAGGLGDDIYMVGAGDSVIENANSGTDEVRTALADYTLAANVERLTGTLATGQILTGNDLANVIRGGAGGDRIDGGAGADNMAGGLGNDSYVVDNAGDVVTELASQGTDEIRTALATFSLVGIVNVEKLTGTSAAGQTLTGNSGGNVITGAGGNDTLDGGGGIDSLVGGLGNDIYIIRGSFDVPAEQANEGTDEVRTALPNFSLEGYAHIENLTGTSTDWQGLTGNSGANRITGGTGISYIDGLGGDDVMIGGLGDDTYIVDSLGDTVTELAGQGRDEVRTALAVYSLAANVEILQGTSNAGQTLTGNAIDNSLHGGFGDDVLDGAGGSDSLYGSSGNDIYVVGAGDIVTEFAGQGTDEVRTALSAYALGIDVENLTGTSGGTQALTGNGGANRITGGDGASHIDGGAGDDVMIGGLGSDIYTVDSLGDTVTELEGQGSDQVRTALAVYTLAANVEYLMGLSNAGQTLTGNALDNNVHGGSGNDILDGAGGSDNLFGGAGNDIYIVGAGDQVIELAGEGIDEIRTALGNYGLNSEAVENLTGTSSDTQSLYGNGGANRITGGDGISYIDGLGGDDVMIGGLGDDTYIVDSLGDTVTELAGQGRDEVRTGLAAYTLAANAEILQGTSSAGQTLTGNALDNNLHGGFGDDVLDGAGGSDSLYGSGGNDIYIVGAGDSVTEFAGQGSDEVRTALAAYALGDNVEKLTGLSASGQQLTGNGLANVITGSNALAGDRIDGGAGNDVMIGRQGDDVYLVDSAGDSVVELAGEGLDEIRTALAFFSLAGSANVEILTGTSDSGQSLTGNGLANSLFGGLGNDSLNGGAGADQMTGYAGNDTYHVDHSGDIVYEAANAGSDTVVASVDYRLGDNVENLQALNIAGSDPLSLTGNGLRNFIWGTQGNNILDGGAGVDFMIGYAGNDVYHVDNAGDITSEEAAGGSDTVVTSVDYRLGANIENLQALNIAGLAALALTGNGLNNFIWGTQGNNVIDGGGGADFMIGYAGNDIYHVDSGSDIAYELEGGGADTVVASISYTLAANVENLQALNIAGTDPLALTGNAMNNFIWGTQGNNVLNGAGGADFLIGYAGDDSYFVDHVGDIAHELEGGGTDTVVTSISYTLAANVENLQALNIGGTAALSLTGNALRNFIWATQGNNVIDGGAGADFMVGYGGDDVYFADNAGDVAHEEAGGGSDTVVASANYALGANVENLQALNIGGTANLALTGNDQGNFIWGTQGSNLLAGRGGNDRIFGYGGADQFLFNTAAGSANADWLDDFQAGTDKILLDNAVFTALADGALPAGAFVTGTAAADADDRIIFNPADGSVHYDADGSGAGAALLIAYIPVGQALTAADFLIV